MIKTAHESPISLFRDVQRVTDIDYCLVHLLEENEKYLNLFVDSVESQREVILDTSIFELGEAFESSKFAYWVDYLRPTWYIIPDVLEDSQATQDKASEWVDEYDDDVPGKRIGVVQGKSYDEIVECYDFLNEVINVDMLAISFDYSFYEELIPTNNKYLSWMLGRFTLLNRLYSDGIIEETKPHHLLGCALPQEGLLYSKTNSNWDWIYSIDTSNPIVHGLKGIRYGTEGLSTKESTKLFTLINEPKPQNFMWLKNVLDFRDYWNQT